MHTRTAFTLGALALAASGTALAQPPYVSDFHSYVGVAAGESKFRTDCSSFFECDKKDTGWRAFLGGQFNPIVGAELGYNDYGTVHASGGDTKAWSGTIALTLGAPIGDRFRVFAKGGGAYSHTDVSASPSTLFDTGHKTGWGPTYGVGAAFGITQQVGIRVDWDRTRMDFAGGTRDVDLLSAGLQYHF